MKELKPPGEASAFIILSPFFHFELVRQNNRGGQNDISLTSRRALAAGTSLANAGPATDAQRDEPAASIKVTH